MTIMNQSISKLILLSSLLLVNISQGDEGWKEARTRALFDAEPEDLALIETVDFKTARAIRRTVLEWKDLASYWEGELIIADYGSFMSVILYNHFGGIPLVGEQHGIFSRQSKDLYLDCKTFVPITRHEAWERELAALNKCSGKNAKWGRRGGIDKDAKEPLVPITLIIDDIDIARVISVAVSDWDEHTHTENEASVSLWVADHESYFCVSFIDKKCVDDKGVPLRGAHHSYIDSKTYSLVTREDAKKGGMKRQEKETGSE